MNWLNLNIQTLDSENFIGSDPTERGTWLCLLRYCIGQENMGTISDCREWADRKWQQLVRITKKEANRECNLWHWEGETLIVWGYPAEKEQEVQEKRERAKTNGAKGGRPKSTNVGFQKEPTLVISAKAEGERKEKGKEYPLTPEGDEEGNKNPDGQPDEWMPKGWKQWPEKRKGQTRVGWNTERMDLIGKALGRRASTLWTVAETEALLCLRPSDDEINTIIEYYQADDVPKDADWRRQNLITLLNNWNGELDKARIHKANQKRTQHA